jgi:hypothetical protein
MTIFLLFTTVILAIMLALSFFGSTGRISELEEKNFLLKSENYQLKQKFNQSQDKLKLIKVQAKKLRNIQKYRGC